MSSSNFMDNFTLNVNDTREPSGTREELSRSVWYWTIRGCIALLSVLGNGVIIYLIIKRSRLHLTPNWFLLNLLISDFGVGIVNFPLGLICTFVVKCEPHFAFSVLNTFLNASVINLCLMTIDRYIAVVYPFRYQGFMTRCRIAVFITISWCLACCISFSAPWVLHKQYGRIYMIAYCVVLELVPAILLSAAYSHMILIGHRHLKRVTHMMTQLNFNYGLGKFSRYKGNERSAVKVIGAVTSLFILCYSLSTYVTFKKVVLLQDVPDVVIFISTVMVYVNSAVNFVAYALYKTDIRRELTLTCLGHRNYETHRGIRLTFA